MEEGLLRSNLSRVKIPQDTDRIYKHECCISFDTPRSEGGLFVDLNSFLAFGKEYALWNFQKTGNTVYLHIKHTPISVPEDRPLEKSTGLAIGVDDGSEYEYRICILPEYVFLQFPSDDTPYKVVCAVDLIMKTVGADHIPKKEIPNFIRKISKSPDVLYFPPTLFQKKNVVFGIHNSPAIYYISGEEIACERRKYKRGPCLSGWAAICRKYKWKENDEVRIDLRVSDDGLLTGVVVTALHSPNNHRELVPFSGPVNIGDEMDDAGDEMDDAGDEMDAAGDERYTGLANIGNTCYLAATMQVVFSTPSFVSRYFSEQSLKMAFDTAPADPTLDLNMQLTKLGHGLLSGKYSTKEGIPPLMFKNVIAAKHAEFSSTNQQDALEFFLHLLDKVERVSNTTPDLDPARSFKFGVEEKILCSSGKVAYNKRDDCILSLNIPLHEATNKDELEAFENQKAGKGVGENKMSSDEIVRPRVPLGACLADFALPEEIHDFYSTALKGKTTVTKTTRLTSFPDYLVLHMRKFVVDAGSEAKKLEVYIDVPDVIDISNMRSKGLQPGEELLPGDDDIEAPVSHPTSDVDQRTIDILMRRGLAEEVARETLKEIKALEGGIEKATDGINNSSSNPAQTPAPLPDGGGSWFPKPPFNLYQFF